ncbi:MAG: molybdopterin molybdotransferase [Rhodospirillaceae bacterium]|nr:MAG: molybdopterin molybdotransferase [Rhodospirillaceae bacterium]
MPTVPSLSVDDALAAVRDSFGCSLATERVALPAAWGRVLAEDILAPLSLPPHDNAAVDGYGVCGATGGALRLVDRVAAGGVAQRPVHPGEAVRLFTGAPLPLGVDAVVMQEDCRTEGDGQVMVPAGVAPGANCRRAGEDVRRGALALRAGVRLRPQETGLAAAMGLTALPVRVPLRAALFSTGDELHEPGVSLPPGGIHDANRYAVAAALTALGAHVTDLGILPDRVEAVSAALRDAAPAHDLIVTSGGVSVGEEDHVKAAVTALGTLHLWRVKIKPGKPLAIGAVAGVPFLGLPGNPVAALVTFLVIGRAMMLRLSGREGTMPLAYPVPAGFESTRSPGKREFLRAWIEEGDNGRGRAVPFPTQGSAVLSSMVRAGGLIDLAETVRQVRMGETVPFRPFAELLW